MDDCDCLGEGVRLRLALLHTDALGLRVGLPLPLPLPLRVGLCEGERLSEGLLVSVGQALDEGEVERLRVGLGLCDGLVEKEPLALVERERVGLVVRLPLPLAQALREAQPETVEEKEGEPVWDPVRLGELVREMDTVKEVDTESVGEAVCEAEAHCEAEAQREALRVRVPDAHWLSECDCVPEAHSVGEVVLDWLLLRVREVQAVALPQAEADRHAEGEGDSDGLPVLVKLSVTWGLARGSTERRRRRRPTGQRSLWAGGIPWGHVWQRLPLRSATLGKSCGGRARRGPEIARGWAVRRKAGAGARC